MGQDPQSPIRPGPDVVAAITAAYDEHAARLFTWFQSRTRSREVAADLLAETFAVALERIDQLDLGRGDENRWIWGIGKNLYRQYVRSADVERRARERLALRTPAVHDDELELVDGRIDSLELVGDATLRLGALSDGLARAVRLRVLEELPYDRVALECGCSVGAARVRVARGLAILAGELDSLDGSGEEVTL